MCACGKPTVNGEPGYSWDGKSFGVRQPDPPAVDAIGEEIIFDEPGRCGGIDSHCHHFTVVRKKWGGGKLGHLEVLVRHGGGDERINRISNDTAFERALEVLDSDGRYWLLCAMWHAQQDAKRTTAEVTANRWINAIIEKRVKKRKQRGRNLVKVWIEQP